MNMWKLVILVADEFASWQGSFSIVDGK